jgi:hypothetical protein
MQPGDVFKPISAEEAESHLDYVKRMLVASQEISTRRKRGT